MKFDETLFYKQLSSDLIDYATYHDGDKEIINFLVKIGYTPLELVEYIGFNKVEVETIIHDIVENAVRSSFGLGDKS